VQIREALFPDDLSAVRELFEEYAAGLGIDLCFQGFAEELSGLPGRYSGSTGGIWLAEIDGDVAGCIALRQFTHDCAEMKRLYVRPKFRGRGVGRKLVERVLAVAAGKSYSRVCFDTLPSMTGAIALYKLLGFTEIEPYCHNPVPGALYFGRELTNCSAETVQDDGITERSMRTR
jgi:putative acetyltransferase